MNLSFNKIFASAAALISLAASAQSPFSTADAESDDARVMVSSAASPQVGEYLVDANGRSLYLFVKDRPGMSTCYAQCASAWPPLLTTGVRIRSTGHAQAALIGSIRRRDGSMQVTYAGRPLYYYVRDRAPGDMTGQGIADFGQRWYLVSPSGKMLTSGPNY